MSTHPRTAPAHHAHTTPRLFLWLGLAAIGTLSACSVPTDPGASVEDAKPQAQADSATPTPTAAASAPSVAAATPSKTHEAQDGAVPAADTGAPSVAAHGGVHVEDPLTNFCQTSNAGPPYVPAPTAGNAQVNPGSGYMNAYAIGAVAGDPHGSAPLIENALSVPTFQGPVTASATVDMTAGYMDEYVSLPFSGWVTAGVNIQMNVTDDNGTTRCTTSVPILGEGSPFPASQNLTPATYTVTCPFQQNAADDGHYTVQVSLNAFVTIGGLAGGEAQGTGYLKNVGLEICPTGMSKFVDLQSGNCLDLSYADPVIHQAVGEYPCTGAINQAWQHASDGSIRGMGGLCLNITGGVPAPNGTGLQVYPCNPIGSNAQWKFIGELLSSEGPGDECLTSPAGVATQQLVTWWCAEHSFQAWQQVALP